MAKKHKVEEVKKHESVNKEVWAEAERNALNGGGLAGLDEKAKHDLIQNRYDQMVKNDQALKDWAGKDSEILGDVGQKEDK